MRCVARHSRFLTRLTVLSDAVVRSFEDPSPGAASAASARSDSAFGLDVFSAFFTWTVMAIMALRSSKTALPPSRSSSRTFFLSASAHPETDVNCATADQFLPRSCAFAGGMLIGEEMVLAAEEISTFSTRVHAVVNLGTLRVA